MRLIRLDLILTLPSPLHSELLPQIGQLRLLLLFRQQLDLPNPFS